ncbi:hypothetical protein DPM33_23640 [Mesorhizobium hawassense]|uniref:Uncharacterized protein n=1 Tax=Mesorhizobium hawassense TaxID=1209954 RepID=A0A330HII7_9HYPH|nr:hypothetical protein [Mesorhizobium hawassense]RAZ88521.1 hypothetical protein DPM33_23640 [Mesorhizobium hawassense]
METWIEADCPITDEPAARLEKTFGDYEEYRCPTCKHFRISGSAVESIKKYNVEAKLELLVLAKRLADPKGELPFVMNVD